MYKFTILMFAGILTHFVCAGQDGIPMQKKIWDQLQQLKTCRIDSTRAYLLLQIGANYRRRPGTDTDSAELLIRESIALSKRIHYKSIEGDQLYQLTMILLRENRRKKVRSDQDPPAERGE
jgi:hypothetical protein